MRLTLWSVYECLKISFLGKCHAGTSVFSPATRRNREEQLVVSVSSDSHHGYVDWNEYHWLKLRALNWCVILSPSCYQQPENEWSDGWAAALLLYRCYLYFMCLIIYILKLGNLFLALIQARGWECGRCVCVCERDRREGKRRDWNLTLTVTCIWTAGAQGWAESENWFAAEAARPAYNLSPSCTHQPFSPTCMLLTDCDKTHIRLPEQLPSWVQIYHTLAHAPSQRQTAL